MYFMPPHQQCILIIDDRTDLAVTLTCEIMCNSKLPVDADLSKAATANGTS